MDLTEWGDARRADRRHREGYAHAGADLWTEDGVLLGMATQTLVLRSAGQHGQSTRTTCRIVGDT